MIDYAFHHCGCVVRLVRGDVSAMSDMDITTDGFWRSFKAIIISIPAMFFTWVIFGQDLITEGVIGDIGDLIVRQAIVDLILWVTPVALLALALPPLGLSQNYIGLIIVRNWLSAIITYLIAGVVLLYMLAPAEAAGLFGMLFLGVLLVSIWMFLRVTLAALPQNHGIAYGAIVVEVIVIFTLADLLTGFFGLAPAI